MTSIGKSNLADEWCDPEKSEQTHARSSQQSTLRSSEKTKKSSGQDGEFTRVAGVVLNRSRAVVVPLEEDKPKEATKAVVVVPSSTVFGDQGSDQFV